MRHIDDVQMDLPCIPSITIANKSKYLSGGYKNEYN